MSVLVPDMKVFQYVQNGFVYAANNRTCDDKYSHSISAHCQNLDWYKEAERWTKNLLTLNCKSYAARYREALEDESKFYKRGDTGKTQAIQLLKYLQCVRYNIEVKTIQEGYTVDTIKFSWSEQDGKDIELLDRFIDDLKDSIISQIPEYQNAKYSD